MLAIEVEFLTGRYTASAHDDRQVHEWPPHPARLFSALVAEWGSAEEADMAEHRVLEKLETMGAPSLRASEATRRSVVTHYVPVNDPTVIGPGPNKRAEKIDQAFRVLAAAGSTPKQRATAERSIKKERDVTSLVFGDPNKSNPLPSARERQARFYPSVTPADPVVTYMWPEADLAADDEQALDGLLARVTRLGHSSSLVACRLATAPLAPNLVPDPEGALSLRTVSNGQVQALETEYARHLGSRPRSLPASITKYSPVSRVLPEQDTTLAPNTAGELVVFELCSRSHAPRRPGPRHIVGLTTALRGALMHHAKDLPEILSGHREDGSATTRPHVAFVALPDVGHEYARGDVLGVAVLLPRQIESSERRAVLAAIGRWETESPGSPLLATEGGHRWAVSRVTQRPALVGLREETWSSPSTTWASATPVALPWRGGRARQGQAEWDLADEWVVQACAHVGLPEPVSVTATVAPALVGTLPASRYPAFRQGGAARRLAHVTLVFNKPVRGPFVFGSGRFYGLGLMRPVWERRSTDE